jgi:hypothetical protein
MNKRFIYIYNSSQKFKKERKKSTKKKKPLKKTIKKQKLTDKK